MIVLPFITRTVSISTTEQQEHQQLVKLERRQLRKASRRLTRHPSLSQEPAVLRWLQAEEQRVAELEASLG